MILPPNPSSRDLRRAGYHEQPAVMIVRTTMHTDHHLELSEGAEFGPELVIVTLAGYTPEGQQIVYHDRYPIPDPAALRLELAALTNPGGTPDAG